METARKYKNNVRRAAAESLTASATKGLRRMAW